MTEETDNKVVDEQVAPQSEEQNAAQGSNDAPQVDTDQSAQLQALEVMDQAEPQAEVPQEVPEPKHYNTEEELDDEDWWKDEDDYTEKERKELEKMYTSTLREFNENEIVHATIVGVGEKEVLLNIGFKSEGIVPVSEFRDLEEVTIGTDVEVFIESVEDQSGQLILSRKRAKHLRSWERIEESMESDTVLTGQVMRRTKGGFVVDIDGIEAFLPGSQIDVKPVRDFDVYVGRTMEFKVVKINHAYENVVVSHKILIEAKLDEQRKQILANLEKGQVLEGTVKNMTNFGVFIDLGGVDGLLHITDISWGRINHPEEVLELDQKVNIVVLDFDDEKKRISLGMKQLTPHPWESLPEEITEGARVKGRVVTVADYGVFLEIIPGVEGLIHTSEMSWAQNVKNPNELFKVNQELEAVVLNIDRDDHKMSLGLKQLTEDPWLRIHEKYPVGSRHNGLVRNMTNYGLFVELEEGVDGLVHISDLSWTKKFNHPSEYVKVDDNLDVIVLDIDQDNRRLSLGHKQLTEDVWETFASIFTVGSTHKGSVKRIDSKGAVVELDYGVEGTVPTRHLKVAEGEPEIKVDDQIDLVVIEFNKDAKRLVLSHTKSWRDDTPIETRSSSSSSGGGSASGSGGEKRKASGTPKRSKSSKQQGAGKQGGTTLGELDVLAKLKQQMEQQEQGDGAPTPAAPEAPKEEAPKEEVKQEEAPKAETPKAENESAEEQSDADSSADDSEEEDKS
jgi:small subunit ribosomal protein S1